MALFSSVATVTLRPFREYERLLREWESDSPRDTALRVLWGAARLLGVIGVFVSFTSTGRLSLVDLLLASGAFSWVLGVQAAGLWCARVVARTKVPYLTLAALYLEGHGIWLLSLLAICAALLFGQDSLTSVSRVAPIAVLVAFVWGIVVTVALFAKANVSKKRAAAATVTFYVVTTALVLGYYLVLGQLLPILPFGRMPP